MRKIILLSMIPVPHYGELKLGFFVTDTNLEVEIVTARDLPTLSSGKPGKFCNLKNFDWSK